MTSRWALYQYIRHHFRSRRWDAFHSPYLFRLFTYCCNEKNVKPLFKRIEHQRKKLRHSKEVITRKDFGAGSQFGQSREQKIAFVARHALSLPFQCRFISRLAAFSAAQNILEFGTSLGISTAYLAISNPSSEVTTVEGDTELAAQAQQFFDDSGYKNIKLIHSTFEEFISGKLRDLSSIDLVFLDGNHRSDALLHYYEALLPKLHANSIIIVDDIYWSKDMHDGWNELLQKPEVTQSVDCFHFGLLFFRKDFLNKEHHSINFRF